MPILILIFQSDSPDVATIPFGRNASTIVCSPFGFLFKLIYKIYTIWSSFVKRNEGKGSPELNAREVNVGGDPDDQQDGLKSVDSWEGGM